MSVSDRAGLQKYENALVFSKNKSYTENSNVIDKQRDSRLYPLLLESQL